MSVHNQGRACLRQAPRPPVELQQRGSSCAGALWVILGAGGAAKVHALHCCAGAAEEPRRACCCCCCTGGGTAAPASSCSCSCSRAAEQRAAVVGPQERRRQQGRRDQAEGHEACWSVLWLAQVQVQKGHSRSSSRGAASAALSLLSLLRLLHAQQSIGEQARKGGLAAALRPADKDYGQKLCRCCAGRAGRAGRGGGRAHNAGHCSQPGSWQAQSSGH